MRRDDVAPMVARARAAQPGWEAIGFEGRAKVLRRAQKWVLDNSDRVIETIVSETGKTWDDAQTAEIGYAAAAFGFWAKNAPKYLADERVRSSSPFLVGKKCVLRYRPLGVVGVIGPWNYPLTNSFGDCIPALAAGNAVILKPSEVTPLTSLLMAEMLERVRAARGRLPGAHRPGRRGRRADRPRGLRDVHRLHRHRQEGGRARRAHAHPGRPRAGRQGPDDRAARRRPREGGQRRHLLLDAERRARPASRSSACTWRSRSTTSS